MRLQVKAVRAVARACFERTKGMRFTGNLRSAIHARSSFRKTFEKGLYNVPYIVLPFIVQMVPETACWRFLRSLCPKSFFYRPKICVSVETRPTKELHPTFYRVRSSPFFSLSVLVLSLCDLDTASHLFDGGIHGKRVGAVELKLYFDVHGAFNYVAWFSS